jgi:hypothetical protein
VGVQKQNKIAGERFYIKLEIWEFNQTPKGDVLGNAVLT